MAQEVAFVRCASCWEPMGDRPREHGAPACRAAVDIAENASWSGVAWETGNPYVVAEQEMGRASRIVFAHDLACGKVRRVTRWEWLIGITGDERERLRRQLDGRVPTMAPRPLTAPSCHITADRFDANDMISFRLGIRRHDLWVDGEPCQSRHTMVASSAIRPRHASSTAATRV